MKPTLLLAALAFAGCAAPQSRPQRVSTALVAASVASAATDAKQVADLDDKVARKIEVIKRFWPGGVK